MSNQRYCIDTSSLLEAWVRTYPKDIFGGVWRDFQHLVDSGRLCSPEEVRTELGRKDDEIAEWAAAQADLFIPFDLDQERQLIEVLTNHPLLVKNLKGRNAADPFVISLAKTRKLIVITEEIPGGDNRPKIPDVCNKIGVQCMSVLELMRVEGWNYD